MGAAIVVEVVKSKPVTEQAHEIVERKGIGHPDYMIDSACEWASRYLSKYYTAKFGRILHYNVDKGLLVGGRASPRFGGGRVDEKIYIVVAGRATVSVGGPSGKEEVDVDSIVKNAVKDFIKRSFRFLDPEEHVNVETRIRPGSADLRTIVEAESDVPLANDTSYGVGFAPLTTLEKLVYETERMVNSINFKKSVPESGEDCKVMGVRVKDKFKITIADSIISHLTQDLDHYLAVKEQIMGKVMDMASKLTEGADVEVYMNTGDIIREGDATVYLTVTGTSAESGDDGNTGRGNRANGLITPNRYMSLEAVAGKNPVSHVGKIYNIAARIIADKIYEETKRVKEVYVKLLSQIGRPIDKPQLAVISYIPNDDKNLRSLSNEAKEILKEGLRNIRTVTDMFLKGDLQCF